MSGYDSISKSFGNWEKQYREGIVLAALRDGREIFNTTGSINTVGVEDSEQLLMAKCLQLLDDVEKRERE